MGKSQASSSKPALGSVGPGRMTSLGSSASQFGGGYHAGAGYHSGTGAVSSTQRGREMEGFGSDMRDMRRSSQMEGFGSDGRRNGTAASEEDVLTNILGQEVGARVTSGLLGTLGAVRSFAS